MFPRTGRRDGSMRSSWGRWEMIWSGSAADFGKYRRQRAFDNIDLRVLLLALIAENPRHGYDLIREIESRTVGAYASSPEVVYPTLTLLEEMGLIEAQRSEGAKKRFVITEPGSRYLSERTEQVAALLAHVGERSAQRSRSEGGPVRQAMEHLRVVLHGRYRRGDVTSDVLLQIAEVIEEAARRIERL